MKRFATVSLGLLLSGIGGPALADVTFYGQCDYQGNGISLAPGDYTAHELQQLGIPDNAISSIDVPRGYAVTVYEDDLFRGRYGTLRRSDPCLQNDRFDKLISSLTIRETLDAGLFDAADTPAAGSETVATVFSECGFRGQSAALTVGDYNLAQLRDAGIDSNAISSVRVPPGLEVVLYDHDFLRGRAGRLRNDDNCLDNDGFDDITSSLSVRIEGSAGTLAPPAGSVSPTAVPKQRTDTTATATAPAAPVVLYTECNYSGMAVPLQEGEYTTTQLEALGLANNSVSSIRVQAGYEIELYEHDFHRGQSGTLRQHDNCLVDDRFNDVISSVIVQRDSTAVTQGGDDTVATIVYGHCDFKGASVRLGAGRYDAAALAARGIPENVVASLKVADGFRVTLYENGNFTGARQRIDAHDRCLDDQQFLERVSAMLVEPVTSGSSGGTARRQSGGTAGSAQAGQDAVPSLTELLPAPPGGRTAASVDEARRLEQALACVGQYVAQNVCDSHRWRDMQTRCALADVELASDGYLKGHIDAGNCRAELWQELSRRVANPRLR